MPLADPQFAIFQRQIDASEAELQQQAAMKRDAIQRAYARQLPGIDMSNEQNQRQIGDNFAARGVFSSGVRVQRQDEAERQHQLQASNLAAGATDQAAGVDSDLALQIARLRRQAAEQALQSQQASAIKPISDWASAYI